MNKYRWFSILLTATLLTACSRSREVNFYVLNPIPASMQTSNRYHDIRIAIDEMTLPSYMYKSQFIVHYSPHQVKLDEFDQWAGPIDKNIQRVVRTNLATLLPGTIITNYPWDVQFKPTYRVHIDISQYDVDMHGNSQLRASYVVYSGESIRQKGQVDYHQHTGDVTVNGLVNTMNDQLNKLTHEIARALRPLLNHVE